MLYYVSTLSPPQSSTEGIHDVKRIAYMYVRVKENNRNRGGLEGFESVSLEYQPAAQCANDLAIWPCWS